MGVPIWGAHGGPMQVVALTIPSVNWKPFLSLVNSFNGDNPVFRLDEKGMKLSSPLALPMILDENLDDSTLRLFSYGIAGILKKNEATKIMTANTLHFHIMEYKNEDVLFVVVGNILDWRIEIQKGCSRKQDLYTRKFFNECLKLFERTEWKRVFEFLKQDIPDGTFLLTRKES